MKVTQKYRDGEKGKGSSVDAQELWASKLHKYSVGGLKKAIKTVGEKFCRKRKKSKSLADTEKIWQFKYAKMFFA